MGFNPLKEIGTPIEKQFKNWDKLNITPYDKNAVDPYTRTRIILMNGIEVEAALFLHQMARHTQDLQSRQILASARRVEQQQQKMINWLSPGNESVLETTIGYEQVAVDLTAWLARTEPDPYVKQALDFALLEDFDHLYRYANALDMSGKKAEEICGGYTEIFPGRPTSAEHRHPFDSIRYHVDSQKADPLTLLHILVIVSGEQQTMNFYMNAGNTQTDSLSRGLYQEIAMIEEQHVSHYESLADPRDSWWKRLLMHEYCECYMYYSCLQYEQDQHVRSLWDQGLSEEVEHLRLAADLYKKHEGKDPEEVLPSEMPEPVKFEQNKEYVREILEKQVDFTGDGPEMKRVSELPENNRYHSYQSTVNSGAVPSQEIIQKHIDQFGTDYRFESEGPHPLEAYRRREAVTA